MPKREGFVRVVFFLLFVALALLSLYIIRDFVQALIAGAVMAYVFHPVYERVNGWLKRPVLTSLLVCALTIVILLIPIAFVVDNAATEARFIYVKTLQVLKSGELIEGQCQPSESWLCRTFATASTFIENQQVNVYMQDAVSKATTFIITGVTNILFALPSIVISVLIAFFTMFYLLIDGPHAVERIRGLLPVNKAHQAHITRKLGEVTHALIYGSLIIALLQGLLTGLGFWAVGINSPVLWGAITAVLALVPLLGTGLVWGPASIYMILLGLSQGDPVLAYKGVGLLVYGALVVGLADNFLRPHIVGNRTGIHPVLVLVGVLGGIATFGIVGFVIGPLVIALLKSIVTIYETEISHQ